jgi:hypothetical protein
MVWVLVLSTSGRVMGLAAHALVVGGPGALWSVSDVVLIGVLLSTGLGVLLKGPRARRAGRCGRRSGHGRARWGWRGWRGGRGCRWERLCAGPTASRRDRAGMLRTSWQTSILFDVLGRQLLQETLDAWPALRYSFYRIDLAATEHLR